MKFFKYQGIGNDFVLLDAMEASVSLSPAQAQELCDRRFGVGADQVLVLRTSKEADALFEVWNADGSRGEMCGNGIRAAALHLYEKAGARAGQKSYRFETLAGVKTTEILNAKSGVGVVRVDMGAPEVKTDPVRLELKGGAGQVVYEIDTGVPHVVVFVKEELDQITWITLGEEIENHSRYPRRTNVDFVEVLGPGKVRARIWERGAGATLACGTGACASAVAAIATGKTPSPVEVELPGGTLTIEWAGLGNRVFMTGLAERVFEGEIGSIS